MIQHKAPQNAGRKAETKVHHLLFVSLYSVIRVVEQGQCGSLTPFRMKNSV